MRRDAGRATCGSSAPTAECRRRARPLGGRRHGEVGLARVGQPGPRLAEPHDRLAGRLRSDGVQDALVERVDQVLHVHGSSQLGSAVQHLTGPLANPIGQPPAAATSTSTCAPSCSATSGHADRGTTVRSTATATPFAEGAMRCTSSATSSPSSHEMGSPFTISCTAQPREARRRVAR